MLNDTRGYRQKRDKFKKIMETLNAQHRKEMDSQKADLRKHTGE